MSENRASEKSSAYTDIDGLLHDGGEVGRLIRNLDWSKTSLGSPGRWPQPLQTAISLILNSRYPMGVIWGSDLTFFYNDAYAPFLGARHPEALAQPFKDVWAEVWDTIGPFVDTALSGEATWSEDLHLVMTRNGYPEDTWWSFSYSPIRDENGAVIGLLDVCSETTIKVLFERRQRFFEALSERLRLTSKPLDAVKVAVEMLGRHLEVGRCGYGIFDELGEYVTVMHDWTDGIMPANTGQQRLDDFGMVPATELRTGRIVRIVDALADTRLDAADAAAHIAFGGMRASLCVPFLKDGRLAAIMYAHQAEPRRWTKEEEVLLSGVAERTWATIERIWAETALRASEEKYRLIVEGADRYAIFMTSLDGRIQTWNSGAERMFGYNQPEILNQNYGVLFTAEDRRAGRPAAELQQAKRDGTSSEERWYARKNGSRFWGSGMMMSLKDARGSTTGFLQILRDRTEGKRAQEHRNLLMAELNHRVKNTLASIQSIATQTIRNSISLDEFKTAFETRLMALARAHDLLTVGEWRGADLRDLVELTLKTFSDENTFPRAIATGPPVKLIPNAAVLINLVIHELATNAAKYGALSRPTGSVQVSWEIHPADRKRRLQIVWEESGGPEVTEPTSTGFGMKLMKRGITHELDGEIELNFNPQGLQCTIFLPAKTIVSDQ